MSIPVALKLNVYGLPTSTAFADFLDVSQEAERLGFDGLYLPDHLFLPEGQMAGFSAELDEGRPFFPDPWMLMPALAALTDRIRIGPQVTPLMRHDPTFLARAGAAIDWIAPGRFILQVGLGWNEEEYEAFGLPYAGNLAERGRRLIEGVRLITELWCSSDPVTFHGEFFSVSGAPMWPKPLTRPRPAVWIGGNSKVARRAVAEIGDGWTPAAPHYGGMTPEAYAEGLQEVRDLAGSLGREGNDITAAGMFFVVVDETLEKAREVAAGLLRRDIWRELTVEDLARRGIAFIGTPAQVRNGMQRFVEAGVEYFTVAFMPIDRSAPTIRQMRLFKEVLDDLAR